VGATGPTAGSHSKEPPIRRAAGTVEVARELGAADLLTLRRAVRAAQLAVAVNVLTP